MQSKYTDILANAFSEVRAWKLTTLTLGSVCVVLVIALIVAAQSAPVVLVPYGVAAEQSRLKVAPGGDFAGTSPDYLAQVALGDLALILNWQPDNVELQFQRFLNRATSELYARENVRLIDEAKQHRAQGDSQSFYPETTQVDLKQGRVLVDGFLVRWTGDKEALRVKQRVIVSYRTQKGFLHVANVQTK